MRQKQTTELKKNIIGLSIGIFLISLGTWGQLQGKAESGGISEPELNELFHSVLHHVKNDYVEETQAKELWFGAIKGLLASLDDAHTRFMTPDEFNELQVETSGKFGGLGIEISIRDGVLTVVSPIEDTPAMRAGLQPGDKIIEIEKKSTRDMSLTDAVSRLRGDPGTSVNISIAREGEDEILYFDIVREIIKIKIVESAIVPSSNVGYIKLKQFSKTSTEEIREAITEFKQKNIKGIVLDLRWNPGGLLSAANEVANLFIKEGVIVSTRGRRKGQDKIFTAIESNAIAGDLPLVILVNHGSASASEIVTGAVKDHKRGKVVGTKTFGKGSVQNVIPLPHNTAIALTIQKYYTPSGVSIHKKGIEPDYEVKSLDFTKEDKKKLKDIRDQKILSDFTKTHKDYNENSVAEYKKVLKEKNLEVSDFTARFLLKQEINRYKKRNPYDLEFDVQLKKALELLN
ncbi:MAG: S41 family peptidase [Spirochaetia bacterium]|nr:S41 family peptidase [Spirochaetia bacterium]